MKSWWFDLFNIDGVIGNLTLGYFNLTKSYQDVILKASKVQFDLVSAHPKANGFYGARFPLGIVTRLIHVCSKNLI